MLKFRFCQFHNIEILRDLEIKCLEEQSVVINDAQQSMLQHCYSILRDHYIHLYSMNISSKMRQTESCEMISNISQTLLQISEVVINFQQLGSHLSFYVAFQKFRPWQNEISIESFMLSLAELPNSEKQNCNLSSCLPLLNLTQDSVSDEISKAIIIFRSLYWNLENLEECRKTLVSLQSLAMKQQAKTEVVRQIDSFLEILLIYYDEHFQKSIFLDINCLSENMSTTVCDSVAKFESMITSKCNDLSLVSKLALCDRVKEIFQTTNESSVIMKQMEDIHLEIRRSSSILEISAASEKLCSAVENYNKNPSTKNIIQVLNALQKDHKIFNIGNDNFCSVMGRLCFVCEYFESSLEDIHDLNRCLDALDEGLQLRALIDAANNSYLLYLRTKIANVQNKLDAVVESTKRSQNEIKQFWKADIDQSHSLLEPDNEYIRLASLLEKYFDVVEKNSICNKENFTEATRLANHGKREKSEMCLKQFIISHAAEEMETGEKQAVESALTKANHFIESCQKIISSCNHLNADRGSEELIAHLKRNIFIISHQFWNKDETDLNELHKLLQEIKLLVDQEDLPDSISTQMQTLQLFVSSYLRDDDSFVMNYIMKTRQSYRTDKKQKFEFLCSRSITDVSFLMNSWGDGNWKCLNSIKNYVAEIEKDILSLWDHLSLNELKCSIRVCFLRNFASKLDAAFPSAKLSGILHRLSTGECNLNALMIVDEEVEMRFSQQRHRLTDITKHAWNDIRRVLLLDMKELFIGTLASLSSASHESWQQIERFHENFSNRVEQLAHSLHHGERQQHSFKLKMYRTAVSTMRATEEMIECDQLVRKCLDLVCVDAKSHLLSESVNMSLYECLALALYYSPLNSVEIDYCKRILSTEFGYEHLTSDKCYEKQMVKFIKTLSLFSPIDSCQNRLLAQLNICVLTPEEDELRSYLEQYSHFAKQKKGQTNGYDYTKYVFANKSPSRWLSCFSRTLLDTMFYTMITAAGCKDKLDALLIRSSQEVRHDITSAFEKSFASCHKNESDDLDVRQLIINF